MKKNNNSKNKRERKRSEISIHTHFWVEDAEEKWQQINWTLLIAWHKYSLLNPNAHNRTELCRCSALWRLPSFSFWLWFKAIKFDILKTCNANENDFFFEFHAYNLWIMIIDQYIWPVSCDHNDNNLYRLDYIWARASDFVYFDWAKQKHFANIQIDRIKYENCFGSIFNIVKHWIRNKFGLC